MAAETPSRLSQRVSLPDSYETCRALHRAHGTTYYWATKALPKIVQPHVHALYGLCRHADDIVDRLDGTPITVRVDELAQLHCQLREGLERRHSDHPVLKAVVHTANAFDLDASLFDRFFASMTSDLSRATFDNYAELMVYMDGSAAVIGEMMLPLLDPSDIDRARPGARALGVAFQLTNFLRDVGEDLDRGRIYFPLDELRRFGADPTTRRVDDNWRSFCRYQIERMHALYREADEGITFLSGRAAAGIRASRVLYSQILDRIERNDYDVFTRRARVGLPRKIFVGVAELIKGAA